MYFCNRTADFSNDAKGKKEGTGQGFCSISRNKNVILNTRRFSFCLFHFLRKPVQPDMVMEKRLESLTSPNTTPFFTAQVMLNPEYFSLLGGLLEHNLYIFVYNYIYEYFFITLLRSLKGNEKVLE